MTAHRSWTHPPEVEAILAVGSLMLFSFLACVVVFQMVPAENEKYAMLMLGALIGIVKDTFGRYFQATKGAQDQRREQAEVTRKMVETAAIVATNQGPPDVAVEGENVTVLEKQ